MPNKNDIEGALKITIQDLGLWLFDFKVPKRVCVVDSEDTSEVHHVIQRAGMYLENGMSEEAANAVISRKLDRESNPYFSTISEIYQNHCAWFDTNNNLVLNAKDENIASIISSDRTFKIFMGRGQNFIDSNTEW